MANDLQKPLKIHRLAWESWHNRSVPSGCEIAHYCHNRACANPHHLHPATHKENMQESQLAQRYSTGSNHRNHKLIEADIPLIFAMYHDGETMQTIANHFRTHSSNISNILHRKIWKTVPIPFDETMIRGLQSQARKNQWRQGSMNGASKLTESDIPAIFQLTREGYSQSDIAKELHVSPSTIGHTLLRMKWTHVEIAPFTSPINFAIINLQALPCIPYEDYATTPAISAIYLFCNNSYTVLYIGKSTNIHRRITTHVRTQRFQEASISRIFYIPASYPTLTLLEKEAIRFFNPPMNRNRFLAGLAP